MAKLSKEKIFREVVAAAIHLDLKKGHQKWTMADLARVSKVSRTLIYYYFGKSKAQILIEAAKIFGGELAGFTNEKKNYWDEGRIDVSLAHSRSLLQEIPGMAAWYFLNRETKNDIAYTIKKIEKEHLQKIKKYVPTATEDQVLAIFALFFGISFSPLANEATPKEAVNLVLSSMRR